MKKALFLFVLIALVFGGVSCFEVPPPIRIMVGDIYLMPSGSTIQIYARSDSLAIEVSLPFEISPYLIEINPSLASIVSHPQEGGIRKTAIALVNPGSQIDSHTLLLTIPRRRMNYREIQTQIISALVSPKDVEVIGSPNPELLGDFDNTGIVTMINLDQFKPRYGSKTGEDQYHPLYDIGPASNLHGGLWMDILDTPHSDGIIGLDDFYVLMANMGKLRPGGPVKIAIDHHPLDLQLFQGDTAGFSVEVSGGRPPYRYFWKKDGAVIEETADSRLVIPNITMQDAGVFTVEVQDQSIPPLSAQSRRAKLSVSTKLVVQQHPQTQNKREGEILQLTVFATGGTQPYTYRWYHNGQLIAGEDTHELFRIPVRTQDQGSYRVEVLDQSNPQQIVQSNTAAIWVVAAFQIFEHPIDQQVAVGGTATFSVQTSGGTPPYSYQWRKNGADLPGRTSSSLVLTDVQTNDVGLYSVMIRDSSQPQQALTSNHARLLIDQLPTYLLSLHRNPLAGGTASGAGQYTAGASVFISASPSGGYRFVNWTMNGIVISTQPNYAYTMPSENATLVANFELIPPPTYSLTLNRNPTTGGIISGAGQYAEGTSVSILATPSSGYRFLSWTRNGSVISDQASYSYLMPDEDVTLMANFELIPPSTYSLTLNRNPTVGGIVSGAGQYTEGTSVSILATPSAGYRFVNWTRNGNGISDQASYTYPMPSEDVTLTANFVEEASDWFAGYEVYINYESVGVDSYILIIDTIPGAGVSTLHFSTMPGDKSGLPSSVSVPGNRVEIDDFFASNDAHQILVEARDLAGTVMGDSIEISILPVYAFEISDPWIAAVDESSDILHFIDVSVQVRGSLVRSIHVEAAFDEWIYEVPPNKTVVIDGNFTPDSSIHQVKITALNESQSPIGASYLVSVVKD